MMRRNVSPRDEHRRSSDSIDPACDAALACLCHALSSLMLHFQCADGACSAGETLQTGSCAVAEMQSQPCGC